MTAITTDTTFVTETLVTDTVTYEIIGRTAKTITIRTTISGDVVKSQDPGSGYPQVWCEAISDPEGATYTLRLRKDGTYRRATWANALRPAAVIDGKPVSYTDYSF
jgi:hypothetical protein